ncbi:MAG: type I-B CRISPR-associated protein Cas5b [Candidatus Thermoplasmatota archaeon]
MKVLVFDVWGDYAHFKKRYTTTSPLTHSIPPRTTVAGLISAIVGLSRETYQEFFTKNKSTIALQILNPIKKTRITLSLISTKSEHLISPQMMNYFKQHTLINFEFLKNPKYRVYFSHNDVSFYHRVKKFLNEHKSVYTPSLGLSELICNFRYIGEYNAKQSTPTDYVFIHSVIPIKSSSSGKIIAKIHPEEKKKYSLETLPSIMKTYREVEEYLEVLLEEEGRPIEAFPETYLEIEDGTKVIPF